MYIINYNFIYDEQGKHVRTKKEILDENGDVRKGCKIVKKGEIYERNLFTAKNKLFKQDEFVDEVKHFYTDFINTLVKDDKEKLHVFDESGLYLATKKIGKNNPKAEQIQTDNEYRMRWNREVDRAIVSGVAEIEIQQQMSVQETVCQPAEKETLGKPKIPPKPVIPSEAANYPKLFKIYKELKRQNEIIFEAEKERNALELERDDLKGLARFTKKGELQSKTHSAYIAYREQEAECEKNYGENVQRQETRSVYKQLQNYQKENTKQQSEKMSKSRNRGAR